MLDGLYVECGQEQSICNSDWEGRLVPHKPCPGVYYYRYITVACYLTILYYRLIYGYGSLPRVYCGA